MDDKNNFVMLSIVAIVAVVAIIVLVIGGRSSGVKTSASSADISGDAKMAITKVGGPIETDRYKNAMECSGTCQNWIQYECCAPGSFGEPCGTRMVRTVSRQCYCGEDHGECVAWGSGPVSYPCDSGYTYAGVLSDTRSGNCAYRANS